MPDRLLTAAEWSRFVRENKIPDNGVGKSLQQLERLGPDQAQERMDLLANLRRQSNDLLRNRDVASNQTTADQLERLNRSAEQTSREAEREQREGEEEETESAREQEQEAAAQEHNEVLKTRIDRVRAGRGSVQFECLVRMATPVWGITLAKRITPQVRSELGELTRRGRFLPPGRCGYADDKIAFFLAGARPSFVRELERALVEATGRRYRVVVRDIAQAEAGEGDDEAQQGDAGGDARRPAGRAFGGSRRGGRAQSADAGRSSAGTNESFTPGRA